MSGVLPEENGGRWVQETVHPDESLPPGKEDYIHWYSHEQTKGGDGEISLDSLIMNYIFFLIFVLVMLQKWIFVVTL